MTIETKENGLYSFKFFYVFFAYTLLYALLTFLSNEYVYTQDFYYSIFQGTLDSERIADAIHMRQKVQWVSYVVQPVLLLFRCGIFASAIYIGLFLSKGKLSFSDCLKIVLVAEIVAIVVTLIRTVFFIFWPASSFLDLQAFSPLSIFQLLDIHKTPKYLIYPLKQVNLFEVCYWVLLALGVKSLTDSKWRKSFSIIASTYGVSMLVWILIVVFITLQFS